MTWCFTGTVLVIPPSDRKTHTGFLTFCQCRDVTNKSLNRDKLLTNICVHVTTYRQKSHILSAGKFSLSTSSAFCSVLRIDILISLTLKTQWHIMGSQSRIQTKLLDPQYLKTLEKGVSLTITFPSPVTST